MEKEKRARTLLARKLRLLRLLRGWLQETLAFAAGFDRSYISAIERGQCNISLDNIEKLAKAFGFTPDELLGTLDADSLGECLLQAFPELMTPVKPEPPEKKEP